ncbi:MAG: T9SS type A sorting domain-containing protein [Candidatus Marinimicrobia bacterium]|nr:T9SS type A sorting domain-containing protein [Candidatus Neomarinimicrobiota bacterium]
MKSKLLLSAMLAVLLCAGSLFSQEKSHYNYTNFWGYGYNGNAMNASSTYWFGGTWVFFWVDNNEMYGNTYDLHYGRADIYSNGDFKEGFYENKLASYHKMATNFDLHVSSCILSNNMFVCHYYEYEDENYIQYGIKKSDGSDFQKNSISFGHEVKEQMAVVGVNDTLYLFFVDAADHKVKYYRGLVDDHHPPNLTFVDSSPIVISDMRKSAGNISACHFTSLDNKDMIMLAFPGESSDKSTNDIVLYTGIQDEFQIYAEHEAVSHDPSKHVCIEQGSVKGGMTKGYIFQIGYVTNGDYGRNAYRCEFDYHSKVFSDWESLTFDNNEHNTGTYCGFATAYSKGANIRNKFLYQMFIGEWGYDVECFLWYSDKLKHSSTDDRDGTPANSLADKYYDLIMVVEGAPPYVLNGNTLDNLGSQTPSSFSYGTETENTVSVSTTFKQTVEASMGFGPVTAGFSASFQESSGTSQSETKAIIYTLTPPVVNYDSAGFMWYFYTAPHINREQWRLYDYNGDKIEPERSLFFFKFIGLTPRWLKTSLSMFAESPKPYDLRSYVDRNVQGMSFIENSGDYEAQIDLDGLSTEIDLSWSKNKTNSFTQDYNVSLSIDGSVEDIFNYSVGLSAGFEFKRSRTTTCTKSLKLTWTNLSPVWDPSNPKFINNYIVTNYIMMTLDDTAYFLDEAWKKKYSPYFITYEVYDINAQGFGVQDNNLMAEKYSFTNYPNPCTDLTHFTYTIPEKAPVILNIYNPYGQLINTHLDEVQESGEYTIDYSTAGLPSGIFFYRLIIGRDVIAGKMIVR